MPAPIAHCSMVLLLRPLERHGLLPEVLRARRWWLVGLLLFACVMPDMDFAINWIAPGSDLGEHGIGTHSLVSTTVGSLLLAGLWQLVFRKGFIAVLLLLIIAGWSHLLFDMVTHRARGIALLWPFTDERMRIPLDLFFGFRHGELWWWQAHIVTAATELAFAGLMWGLSVLLCRGKRQARPSREAQA